jgi:hypothetical protein
MAHTGMIDAGTGLLLWTVLAVVVQLGIAVTCGWVAARKGYSRVVFTLAGFVASLITLLVLVALPDRSQPSAPASAPQQG